MGASPRPRRRRAVSLGSPLATSSVIPAQAGIQSQVSCLSAATSSLLSPRGEHASAIALAVKGKRLCRVERELPPHPSAMRFANAPLKSVARKIAAGKPSPRRGEGGWRSPSRQRTPSYRGKPVSRARRDDQCMGLYPRLITAARTARIMHAPRPLRGAIMRRREAGRGAAPAGLVATRHPGGSGAPSGTTRSPCQELADSLRRNSIRPSTDKAGPGAGDVRDWRAARRPACRKARAIRILRFSARHPPSYPGRRARRGKENACLA